MGQVDTSEIKEIISKKSPLVEFAKWMNKTYDNLSKNEGNFIDYIRQFDFINDNEELTIEFFKYCYYFGKNKHNFIGVQEKLAQEAEDLFYYNTLGTICFITPEIGRWSNVGGLGVMIDELSQGLVALGQKVAIISPYYNKNSKGEKNYLAKDQFNIHYVRKVTIELDEIYSFSVYFGSGNGGIQYYFIQNEKIFPEPYPDLAPVDILREIACFAKASFQVLCDFRIIPSIILTSDWFSGLVHAYARSGAFGETFQGTTLFHICYNLNPSNEGRLFPKEEEGTLEVIYRFDPEWLIDPSTEKRVINPSRCAIMLSDQWGTASNSYKNELLETSSLKELLNKKTNPFSYPNGICKEKYLKELKEKCVGGKEECKKYIQQRYFGYKSVDHTVPMYSFVGPLCEQKGILLILESIEELIDITGAKMNILIGGTGKMKDPYFLKCFDRMKYLKSKFPKSFWANPIDFFTDRENIIKGSDFCLMPSLYEPGGIEQHEFFLAGTPVIAHKTGVLQDSVFEFDPIKNTGNGFIFEKYDKKDFIDAIKRSLILFQNKKLYEICQKNAYQSVIDISDVSKAWCKELFRLQNKVFFNVREAQKPLEEKDVHQTGEFSVFVDYNGMKSDEEIPIIFSFKTRYDKPQLVCVCTSFDNWETKRKLNYDSFRDEWNIKLNLSKGKYLYKYIVDGNWLYNPKEEIFTEEDGTINNVINI